MKRSLSETIDQLDLSFSFSWICVLNSLKLLLKSLALDISMIRPVAKVSVTLLCLHRNLDNKLEEKIVAGIIHLDLPHI